MIWHASVSTAGPLSRVNATIFQPKVGVPEATMMLIVGGKDYQIATVKGGAVKGAATAKAERQGAGGTLAIEGRTASGQSVALTVSCSAFAAPEDNG